MAEENPDNLPVIEENSLHRIVTTVKLYQEFKSLGKEKFEEIYENDDPEYQKTLVRVCYDRYYKNYQKYGKTKPFELLKIPLGEGWQTKSDGVFSLELGDYLKVDLNQNKKVTEIQSLKPFYWKDWTFEEDIEREDWSRVLEIDKERSVVGNFTPDENIKNKNNPFIKYDFDLDFKNITFGLVKTTARSYFKGRANFESAIFEGDAYFVSTIFEDWISFDSANFKAFATFGSTFENTADFRSANFKDRANFMLASFKGDTCFESATFKGWAFFMSTNFNSWTNFKSVNFEYKAYFRSAKFKNMADFESVTFNDKADFEFATFMGRADFSSVTFRGESDFFFTNFYDETFFNHIRFKNRINNQNNNFQINFSESTFHKDFYLQPDISKEQNLTIDLSNNRFENRLNLSLVDDSLYKNLTINLKNISYMDFVCDDYNLHKTKLWYTENQLERKKFVNKYPKPQTQLDFKNEEELLIYQEKKSCLKITDDLKEKDITEQAISERRVFRKILQDLNWGDKADEEYARIMNLQTKLKGILGIAEKLVFGVLFGWGIRLKNILISGVVLIFSFYLIYSFLDINLTVSGRNFTCCKNEIIYLDTGSDKNPVQLKELSHNRLFLFSTWNFFSIAVPDQQVIPMRSDLAYITTAESISGIVWVTTAVAIFSRKFMRM
jgi:hypothetical protein